MVTVKGPVHKLYLWHFFFYKKCQFLLYRLQIPEAQFFINGRQTIAAAKRASAAGFIINNPVFKNKNYPESDSVVNTAFYADGKNYLQMKNVRFSLISGAFANSINLKKIVIPKSVKFIGENAFRNTSLSSVKISADCTYGSESFPDGCKIEFY